MNHTMGKLYVTAALGLFDFQYAHHITSQFISHSLFFLYFWASHVLFSDVSLQLRLMESL